MIPRILTLLALVAPSAIAQFTGCTGNSPVVSSFSPSSLTAGQSATSLGVYGNGFLNQGPAISWNGTIIPATLSRIFTCELSATIPANLLANPGTVNIAGCYKDIDPGYICSTPVAYTIRAAPSMTSLNPFTTVAGGSTFTLTVNGQNFFPGDTLLWNGTAQTTTYISSTQMSITVDATQITQSGIIPLSVRTADFLVYPGIPFIILQPVTVTTTPPGLAITVDGVAATSPQIYNWVPGSGHLIGVSTQQTNGGTRSDFQNWSDSGGASHTINAPFGFLTYTANFSTSYLLTTAANPSGGGSVSPSSGFQIAGSTVIVTATPANGQQFNNWSGDNTSSTNPLQITMSAPRTLTANFSAAPQGITITTNPPGLPITVDNVSATSPQTYNWIPGSSHNVSVPSQQTNGGTRYDFQTWADGGGASRTIIAPAASTTYTASFSTSYLLTTAANPAGGGSVTPATGFQLAGSTVNVTATPANGQQFNNWSGDNTSSTNPLQITMSAPRTLTANFSTAPQGITITTNPSGLPITVDNVTANSPQTYPWIPGSTHNVSVPSQQTNSGTRYDFQSWIDGGGTSRTIIAPATSTTYTATYSTSYLLTTAANPSGSGSVSPSSGYQPAGSTVTVTATPVTGQQFNNWSGDSTSTTNPLQITMSAPRTLTANFGSAPTGSASACIATLNPPRILAPATGGSFTTDLTVPANCPWTATAQVGWVTVTTAPTGTGSSTIGLSISPSTTNFSRNGTVAIAGLTLPIIQAGRDCTATGLSAFEQNYDPNSSTGSVTVSIPPGCPYQVSSSNTTMLNLTSSASPTGPGAVTFNIQSNPSPAPRTATLTLAGLTFTARQAGSATSLIRCDFSPITPLELRSLGRTELLPEINLTCSGRTTGQPLTADVVLRLNTAVTSRLTAADTLAATLTVDSAATFPGRLDGPSAIRFANVPLSSGEISVSRQLRISGVRADISLLGTATQQPEAVTGSVTVQAPFPGMIAVTNPTRTLGFSRPAIKFTRQDIRTGPVSGQQILPFIVEEGFLTAFHNKQAEGGNLTRDTGTLIRVRFANISGTTAIYVPTSDDANRLRLVQDSGDGTYSPVPGSPRAGGVYQPLIPASGTGYAFYEVLSADNGTLDNATLNFLLEGATTNDISQLRTDTTLGPISNISRPTATDPIPRFLDALQPPTLVNLSVAVTTQTGSRPTVIRTPVTIGGTVTLNYNVLNGSDQAATLVTLRDTLPPGFTPFCTSPQFNCTVNGQQLQMILGAMAAGTQTSASAAASVGGLGSCPSCSSSGSVSATQQESDIDPSDNRRPEPFEPDSPCTFTLSRSTATAPPNASVLNVGLTTGPTCDWTAPASSGVVGISPSGALRGSTDIALAIPANSQPNQRTLTVVIANQTLLINQSGTACDAAVSTGTPSVTAAGGEIAVQIEIGAGCPWQAAALPSDWITFPAGASGTGRATLRVTFGVNQSVIRRTANLEINGRILSIAQQPVTVPAPTCTATLSPTSATIDSNGGTSTITLTTGSGCTWNAVSGATWFTVSPSSGSGSQTLTITADPNLSAARTANAVIAGTTLPVSQNGTSQPPPNTTGLRFVRLEPCRVLETRPEYNFQGRTGNFGPPFLRAGETRTLTLAQSNVCSIPANASAYVFNVTLVPRGPADFVTIWPAGQPRPTFWTVRSPDGLNVANSAIVAAGNGAIQIYTSNDVDLILDISGYFTDNAQTSNLAYYPLPPCRVVETRSIFRAAGPFGPPSMTAGGTRRFRLPDSTDCSIPRGAAAYSVTLTAVPPGPLQFLTAWPAGASQPNVSNLNSPNGRVLANSVILPPSADGSIDVYTFDRTDFLIDITGYFAPDNGQGLFYFPVTQCRVSDTRNAAGTYGGPAFTDESTRTIPIPASSCQGIPATAKGYYLNATALPGGSEMPFLTIWPSGQTRPNVSFLNAFQGQTVTGAAIIPASSSGSVDIFAYRRTNVVLEVSGYFGR